MREIATVLIIVIVALAAVTPTALAGKPGSQPLRSGVDDLPIKKLPIEPWNQSSVSKTYHLQKGWEETLNSPTVTMARIATEEEIEELKAKIGVRAPDSNYNTIIDGHGTGLAPPTDDEWNAMVGSLRIVKSVSPLTLPTSIDHSQEPYFPPVGDQGQQGSCASWSTAYYTNGYLQAKDNGWTDTWIGNTDHLTSPAWVYNKINKGVDDGSTLVDPIELMQTVGNATLSTMPYDDSDYTDWGSEAAWRSAPKYRVGAYETTPASNTDALKTWLADGYVCTMALDAYMYEDGLGPGDDTITSPEYDPISANHANTIVGYDDTKSQGGETGAFKIVNSWGSDWGSEWGGNGYYWMTYDAVAELEDPVYRFHDKVDYEPSLLGVWNFDPQATRDAPVTMGIGPHGNPDETRSPTWDGGSDDFPSFMCLDITEFEDEWNAGSATFFLEIGSGTGAGTITSFKVEFYEESYNPGSPTRTSNESPDTPRATPDNVTVYFPEDVTEPNISIDDIPEFVNSLAQISGTASDNMELNKVEVVVHNTTDNTYWNGSSWVDIETWLDASGTTSWSYTIPALTDGKVYTVKAKAIDKAGNESNEASDSFTYDTTAPITASVITPAHGVHHNDTTMPSTLSGSVADNSSGGGLGNNSTTFTLKRSDNKYWGGDSWQDTATWLVTTHNTTTGSDPTAWVSNVTMPAWADDTYTVQAKATDKAGNTFTGSVSTFVYDISDPTVTINDIADFVNVLAQISGIASDTSPGELEKVQVQINNTADSTYWDGSNWVSAQTWLDANGTASWSFSLPTLTDGKSYEAKAKAIDKAGNESSVATGGFTLDTTDPMVSITDIADFVNALASISGTASDTSLGHLEEVQVVAHNTTDNTYWDGSNWVSAQTWLDVSGTTLWSYDTSSVTFTDGKVYTVRAKSIDQAGNPSTESSDNFTIDTTYPSLAVTSPNGDEYWAGGGTQDVTWTASDDNMAANPITIEYYDGNTWVEIATGEANDGVYEWTVPMLDIVTARMRVITDDKAGNSTSDESNANFTIDSTNPAASITDFVSALASISGTASDASPGELEKVQVVVHNTTDNTHWDGSNWVSTETWLDASGTASWNYTVPTLTDGKSYEVKAKAIDKAGNESNEASDSFTYTTIVEAPAADFSVSPTGGGAPLTVQFTNNSTGDITDWEWDFNNDGILDSTEQNPSYIYETAGNYTVSLKVAGPGGGGIRVKSEIIMVKEKGEQDGAEDKNGGGFDCGCSHMQAKAPPGELLIGWATVGLCWGTGYYLVRRVNRHKK